MKKQPKLKENDPKALQRVNDRMIKGKAMNLFRSAKDAREKYDWRWLTRDLFRRGYQFSTYNPKDRSIALVSKRGVKLPVNLLWVQMRSVKNQVTNFKPKWEVLKTGKSPQAVKNAKLSGALLDYYYGRLGLRKTIKETVMQGLMYSVGGPWQIGYDANADRGKGEVTVWLLDPYDFYVDPLATSIKEAQYCVKAIRKTLSEITTNPVYNFYDDIPETGDSMVASSPSKQFLLQALKSTAGTATEKEEEGVILKEVWVKTRVGEDNIKDLKKELVRNGEDVKKLQEGEVLMRIVHYIDKREDPLLVQLKRRSDFPFVMYQADINPLELYGESWAKHIIPINKVLNALESSVFSYNYRYALGRIVMDKNSGVRIVANEHGSFIEKNRGSEVTSLPLQPLPRSYQQQINNCWKYIEDLGGSHEASRGILPESVTSGIAIAELKQADSTNSSDLVDNLEDFLVNVGKKILAVISKNYSAPKVAKDMGLSEDIGMFAFVGEAGKRKKREVSIGTDTFDLAVIGADNEIRVSIGSWLAYTKTAQQERIKELFNAGLIDANTALKHMEFSDVSTIVENVRKKEILDKMAAPEEGAEGLTGEEIARTENIIMVQENRPIEPLPTDNHAVHNIVHQEALGQSGNKLVEDHMRIHIALGKRPRVTPLPNEGAQMQPSPGMAEIPEAALIEAGGPAGPPAGPSGPAGELPPTQGTQLPPEVLKGLQDIAGEV